MTRFPSLSAPEQHLQQHVTVGILAAPNKQIYQVRLIAVSRWDILSLREMFSAWPAIPTWCCRDSVRIIAPGKELANVILAQLCVDGVTCREISLLVHIYRRHNQVNISHLFYNSSCLPDRPGWAVTHKLCTALGYFSEQHYLRVPRSQLWHQMCRQTWSFSSSRCRKFLWGCRSKMGSSVLLRLATWAWRLDSDSSSWQSEYLQWYLQFIAKSVHSRLLISTTSVDVKCAATTAATTAARGYGIASWSADSGLSLTECLNNKPPTLSWLSATAGRRSCWLYLHKRF